MYRYPGHPNSVIGDFEVVVHEDRLHLFPLLLACHDLVGHLVSDDGLTWQELPIALRVGDPGEFDDDQIWTMGIFRHAEKFFMLYTGKKLSERGRVERTGLAISSDLIHWEKYAGNPVAEADPRWYVAADTLDARIQWRDPHVMIAEGVFHAMLAAQEKDGPYNFSGCVGHFTSEDGYRWEVRPPLYRPRVSYDFEIPSFFRLRDKYYMVANVGHLYRQCYRVADRLEGPWRRPDHDLLVGGGNLAYRPFVWHGKTYLMNWLDYHAAVWAGGLSGRVLVAPREVVPGEGETIYLKSFTGWEQRAKAPIVRPRSADFLNSSIGLWGRWESEGETLRGRSDSGYAFKLLSESYDDFVAEITIESGDAREFGLLFRSEPTVDVHTAALCQPGYSEVSLIQYTQYFDPATNHRWRGCQRVHSEHFDYPLGRPIRLHVVASGPYIEISLDERLLLAATATTRQAGHVGVFVADGQARFSGCTILPIQSPFTESWRAIP